MKAKAKTELKGFFVSRPVTMLAIARATGVEPGCAAHPDRLEIEYSRHKRKTNGHLLVTYADFQEFGVHPDGIAPALRELRALGLIEIVQQGSAGNAEHRQPNWYRITYLPDAAGNDPTDEWRTIATLGEADSIAVAARRAKTKCSDTKFNSEPHPRKQGVRPQKFGPEKDDARAGEPSPDAPLRGEEAEWHPLHETESQGSKPVPASRRRTRKRRSER